MTTQSKLFWVAVPITVGWIVFMRPYTPKNIIAFEFAKTTEQANAIMEMWGTHGVELARTGIYLDFIFLILYATTIMLGCKVAARYSSRPMVVQIGNILSISIWMAALCDSIENLAMLNTLAEISSTTVSIAYYFAALKFSIVLICMLFVIIASALGSILKINQYLQQK